MKNLTKLFLGLATLFVANVTSAADYPDPAKMAVPVVAPAELNMDAAALDRIDAIVEENIEAGNFPGAVVAIGRGNKLAFLRAYGDRQTEPTVEQTTFDTLYDLASLTKVTATAIATTARIGWCATTADIRSLIRVNALLATVHCSPLARVRRR